MKNGAELFGLQKFIDLIDTWHIIYKWEGLN